MSTYTIVGDPHITHKSLERSKKLFEIVEELGKPVIWLGDMLDTKEVIRGKCQNFLFDYFLRSKLGHTVLVGNHDYFNLDCKEHSLQALSIFPNVVVVDKPIQFDNSLFIPYIHDPLKLDAALKPFENKELNLFGHLEVRDFDYGNGQICTSGTSLERLKGFKRVISGHFHKYQEMGNLVYLGTPMSHSFGESNQIKYIAEFDTYSNILKLQE